MTLSEELRTKKSRDNRELLDRAADEIERLRDALRLAVAIATVPKGDGGIKQYGGYVEVTDVLDLPSTLKNEEKISEKEKLIEEMAIVLSDGGCKKCDCDANGRFNCKLLYDAELLYNAGYRKQSEGEWIENEDDFWVMCSECGTEFLDDQIGIVNTYSYCPNCGAKMKGGE